MIKRIIGGLMIVFCSVILVCAGENYYYDAPGDTAKAVILIGGNNIIVGFNNAELKGSNKKTRMNFLVWLLLSAIVKMLLSKK